MKKIFSEKGFTLLEIKKTLCNINGNASAKTIGKKRLLSLTAVYPVRDIIKKNNLRLPKGNLSLTGFTLVEVLIAITIIVIVFAASIQVFLGNIVLTQTNEGITKAVNDLSDVMEAIRGWNLRTLILTYPDGSIIPEGVMIAEFSLPDETITIHYPWIMDPRPQEIQITISWTQNARTLRVEARTLKLQ